MSGTTVQLATLHMPTTGCVFCAVDAVLALQIASAPFLQVAPGTLLPRQIGNCYTASLWAGLASLIDSQGEQLAGRTILMFSYGSGVASSFLLLTGRRPQKKEFWLENIAKQVLWARHCAVALFICVALPQHCFLHSSASAT